MEKQMARKTEPVKAYKNLEFLSSTYGRELRILAEFKEPFRRFRNHNILDTIVFFGSARLKSNFATTHSMHLRRRQ